MIIRSLNYVLYGNQMKAVFNVKDLGIYITSNLSWSLNYIVLETVQEFSTSNTRVLLSSVASTPQKGLGHFRERTT